MFNYLSPDLINIDGGNIKAEEFSFIKTVLLENLSEISSVIPSIT